MRRHAANSPTDHPLSLIQYLDMKTYLVGDILTKVDRARWRVAGAREPLLDHPNGMWVIRPAAELKLRGGEGKYILKKALEPYLPHDIMYRPKQALACRWPSWFRGPLKERVRNAVLV